MNKRTIAHVGGAYKQRIAPGNPTKGSYALTPCHQRIDRGGAARGYVAGGQCKHRQFKLRSKSYFAGQIGGQTSQQLRVCDGAAALAGWVPA